jgi:hypothetical protein
LWRAAILRVGCPALATSGRWMRREAWTELRAASEVQRTLLPRLNLFLLALQPRSWTPLIQAGLEGTAGVEMHGQERC